MDYDTQLGGDIAALLVASASMGRVACSLCLCSSCPPDVTDLQTRLLGQLFFMAEWLQNSSSFHTQKPVTLSLAALA